MKMQKCQKCKKYTLKKAHCSEKTTEAGYRFIKVKSASSVFQAA